MVSYAGIIPVILVALVLNLTPCRRPLRTITIVIVLSGRRQTTLRRGLRVLCLNTTQSKSMHDLAHAALTSLDANGFSSYRKTYYLRLKSMHDLAQHILHTCECCTQSRRCSYLVCFCHLTNCNAVKCISAIWFLASPTIRGRLRVLCETLNSQRSHWSTRTLRQKLYILNTTSEVHARPCAAHSANV